MFKHATIVRFGSALASVAVLLLDSGCRSTSVNTARPSDPGLGAAPPAPFFRSYERSQKPYADDQLAVPPAPPMEVPPVPGYSEPEVPPAPTSQKRRRPWYPAATKPQPVDSTDSPVDQTGARILDQGTRASQARSVRRSSNSQNSVPQLQDVPVPLPSSTSASTIEQWPHVPAGGNTSVSPGHSEINDFASAPTISKTPVRTGTINSWPDSRTTARSRTNPVDAGQSDSLSREAEGNSSTSRGAMPNLLPQYR